MLNSKQIIHGDCLEVLKTFPDNSIDSLVSDPPAGVSFMGKEWDSDKGGRKQWCSYMEERFAEALRVCKPGAHALVWALPRTSHWTATALEDAGWEIRDIVNHAFGCLDPETKVVTPNGSAHYQTLEKGSLVLCYDLESKTYNYQPVQAVYEYEYEDTAYRFVGDFGEIIVSRNHRCIVERDGKEICIEAESLQREENIPILENLSELQSTLGSKNKRTVYEKFLLWNELCQASSFSRQNRHIQNTRSYLPGLRQRFSSKIECSNKECKVLQFSMLRGMEIQRSSDSESFSVNSIKRTSWMDGSLLQSDGRTLERRQKPILEGWGNLCKEERQLCKPKDLLCEMPIGVYAYGTKRRICDRVSTNSGKSTESMLSQYRSGSSCQSRCDRQSHRKLDAFQEAFRSQKVRARARCNPAVVRVEPFHYSGKVWCIEVPTGFFVAERNGVVFPTGNSGFPKSLDISAKIDEMAGKEREVIGLKTYGENGSSNFKFESMGYCGATKNKPQYITVPATPEAKNWDGYGTGLKPSHENWILCRKPIEGTIAQNCLTHGVGGINVDACRVDHASDYDQKHQEGIARGQENATNGRMFGSITTKSEASSLVMKGRWPSNLVLSHLPECTASDCVEGCAVAELDKQGGIRKTGTSVARIGSSKTKNIYSECIVRVEKTFSKNEDTASRYFPVFHYFPKASQSDRTCNQAVENNHPTVKNRDLMRWLVKLITPSGGTVLDIFGGSGSTAIACLEEGFNYVLIEQDADFIEIAKARVHAWQNENKHLLTAEERLQWLETQVKAQSAKIRKIEQNRQMSIFDIA